MTRAVIVTGGKQYLVATGDSLKIEKLSDTAKVGDTVVFDRVLMVESDGDVKLGTPVVEGAKVSATIEEIGRERKVIVIHFKSKTRERKKAGHRQPFFKVKIGEIK